MELAKRVNFGKRGNYGEKENQNRGNPYGLPSVVREIKEIGGIKEIWGLFH